MTEALGRIYSILLRYLFLHKRSITRTLEIIFWPVMELLVWGFLTNYLRSYATGDLSRSIVYLINAIIFWDLLYRSQQGVSLSFVEDIWTQNILNILISPLKISEWLLATFLYGLIKTTLITAILAFLALQFYHFDLIDTLGFHLLPLVFNLLLFGWSLGIFTSALLMRWGHSVEGLIWGIPFLIQPLSAIYYPLSSLPSWIRPLSLLIPSTYVFEGMREVINTGRLSTLSMLEAFAINGVFFFLCSAFFKLMYTRAKVLGRLGRLGMD